MACVDDLIASVGVDFGVRREHDHVEIIRSQATVFGNLARSSVDDTGLDLDDHVGSARIQPWVAESVRDNLVLDPDLRSAHGGGVVKDVGLGGGGVVLVLK